MNRLLRIALVVVVVVTAVGGLATREVRAQLQPQFAVLDACRTSPASATATWSGSEGQFHRMSPDGSYATGTCGRWVVDVDAGPFTVQAHGGYAATFRLESRPVVPQNGMQVLLNQQQCENLVVDVTFYRASQDGSFTRLSAAHARGVWQVANGGGSCLVPNPSSDQLTGSTSATQRYRIAAVARLQGTPNKINASGVRRLGNP